MEYCLQPENQKHPFNRPWMYGNSAAGSVVGGGGGFKGFIVGSICGGLEILFAYPMELVKTKLQLDEKSGVERRYKGFTDCIKKTVSDKGFSGMYRGLSVVLIFSVPKVGLRFGTFEMLKTFFTNGYGNVTPLGHTLFADIHGNLTPMARVLCGFGAGVSEAVFAVTPMETLKVKFIHDQQREVPKFRGIIHGVTTIIKTEGFKGVYQGVTPTIIRQGSNQAIRFFVMETLKHQYRGENKSVIIPTPVIGLFGIAAGAASVLGNNPVDVIKTRMQGLQAKQYNNSFDCFVKVWKNEGIRGFYKGAQTRLLRVCFDVSFTFMVYEQIMRLFQ